jgi:hypothetical protein
MKAALAVRFTGAAFFAGADFAVAIREFLLFVDHSSRHRVPR